MLTMKRTKHTSRLDWYGVAAAGFVLAGNQAVAQIEYTDLDPDVIRQYGELPFNFPLNIDADGPIDFNFGLEINSLLDGYDGLIAAPWFLEPGNGVAGITYSFGGIFPVGMASQFSSGDEIGYGNNFVGFNDIVSSSYYAVMVLGVEPEFSAQENLFSDDAVPHFVGLRIEKDGNTHYGWARVSVDPGYSGFVMYDYAWNTAPGESIIAGDTGMETCETPELIGASVFSPTIAKVKWAPVPDALAYQVNYRAVGDPVWYTASIGAPKTSKKLTGLLCASTYEWRVRAACVDGSFSPYSDLLSFTTLSCRDENTLTDEIEPTVYAFGQEVHVLFDALPENASMHVFDIQGQLILEENLVQNHSTVATQLPMGLYVVKVHASNMTYSTMITIL
jgi:hypothetical protein